jgi:hypothetical protein
MFGFNRPGHLWHGLRGKKNHKYSDFPKTNHIMETVFYIKFTIRTPDGFEPYAKAFIANDRVVAMDIFSKLKGDNLVNESNILQLDFVESHNELPLNISLLRCTLQEMAENFKIITREVFKNTCLKQ